MLFRGYSWNGLLSPLSDLALTYRVDEAEVLLNLENIVSNNLEFISL